VKGGVFRKEPRSDVTRVGASGEQIRDVALPSFHRRAQKFRAKRLPQDLLERGESFKDFCNTLQALALNPTRALWKSRCPQIKRFTS